MLKFMEIDKLTIGEARQIAALLGNSPQPNSSHPFEIGAGYFFRTVTYHLTGRIKAVYPTEIVVTEAAWIADDGRFESAVKSGTFSEVEPFPDGEVIIGRGSLVDAVKASFLMPRSQK